MNSCTVDFMSEYSKTKQTLTSIAFLRQIEHIKLMICIVASRFGRGMSEKIGAGVEVVVSRMKTD